MNKAIRNVFMFRPHVLDSIAETEERNARAVLADPYAPATLRQQAHNLLASRQLVSSQTMPEEIS